MGDAVTWLLQMLADVLGPYVVPVYLLAAFIIFMAVVLSVSGFRNNRRRARSSDEA